jgi:hypothetical protein
MVLLDMMRNKETDMTLEKRIETAIAENTDPFTTNADIRFFETEEWNAAKVLGTKIIGYFGATIPLWEGKVVEAYSRCSPEVKIEWDNGSYSWMMISNINSAPSVNGSPIGYYTEEAYYE